MNNKNSNKPITVADKLEVSMELNERKDAVLKGLINLIPYAGPIICELTYGIKEERQLKRITTTLELLKQKVSEIDKKKISQEYLNSDDFYDFTRGLIDKSIVIKSEEKRNILANIYLKATLTKADYEASTSRLFLNIIENLSIIQINILKFIDENFDELREIGSYQNLYALYIDKETAYEKLNKAEFKSYASDLEAKALVSFDNGLNDYNSTSKLKVMAQHKEPSADLTTLGKEFLEFIVKSK